MEVAKMRAARVLWAKILKGFGAKNPKSMALRTHSQTSGWSLTDQELLADVVRERPGKRCAVCGKPVYSSSNRAKYCPACAKQERRKQDAKRKREQYWNLRK